MFIGRFSRKEKAGKGILKSLCVEFEYAMAAGTPLRIDMERAIGASRESQWGTWQDVVGPH